MQACQLLNSCSDIASPRFDIIDQVTYWINSQLNLSGKRLCDLGCGPGLYTERFAKHDAKVTGVDFSKYTLDYARQQSGQSIDYIQADYLLDKLPLEFDVITLIYTDLCVLSPKQRSTQLARMRKMLNPGGHIVIDVAGTGLLDKKEETTLIENKLMNGFWAPGEYTGIQKSFVYDEQFLTLDRYVICEPDETWQVYNWFEHYTPQIIEPELHAAGFIIEKVAGDLTSSPLTHNSDLTGVIARALEINHEMLVITSISFLSLDTMRFCLSSFTWRLCRPVNLCSYSETENRSPAVPGIITHLLIPGFQQAHLRLQICNSLVPFL